MGYTTTVHKVQGKEFNHGIIVLTNIPEKTPMVHKQMLYTALTRFKKSIRIYSDDPERVINIAFQNDEKMKNTLLSDLL